MVKAESNGDPNGIRTRVTTGTIARPSRPSGDKANSAAAACGRQVSLCALNSAYSSGLCSASEPIESVIFGMRGEPMKQKEAKMLKRLYWAQGDIQAARELCEHVLENTKTLEPGWKWRAMESGIVVSYARPFGENEGLGRVPRRFDGTDRFRVRAQSLAGDHRARTLRCESFRFVLFPRRADWLIFCGARGSGVKNAPSNCY